MRRVRSSDLPPQEAQGDRLDADPSQKGEDVMRSEEEIRDMLKKIHTMFTNEKGELIKDFEDLVWGAETALLWVLEEL